MRPVTPATTDHPLAVVAETFEQTDQGTLTDRAYGAIRASILDGTLPPRAQLREADLAKVISISRTPVREALTRLLTEGLVAIGPNRAMEVRDLDLRACLERYEILAVLEPLAVKLAAEKAEENQVLRLRQILELKQFFQERDRWEEVTKESLVFHEMIYQLSGNAELASIVQRLRQETHRFRRLYIRNRTTADEALQEDWQIVRLIEQKDGDAAFALMAKHIQTSTIALEEMIRDGISLDDVDRVHEKIS